MRLIDADANIETMRKCAENPESEQALLCYRFAQRILEEAPTVEPASRWHRVEDELPESNDAVNVVWVNRNPESYYAGIKGKPFVATAHYHKGKWYWFSATCKDFLDEYGRCEVDEVDKDIDILYWMPLPSPPVNKLFTK